MKNQALPTSNKSQMSALFVEEIIELTPATRRPVAPARQYSADPEQYEGGTRINLLPLVLFVVALIVMAFAVMALLPK